jgi:hypothetical protein
MSHESEAFASRSRPIVDLAREFWWAHKDSNLGPAD